MFSYAGITPKQATLLADKYHIYLLHTGRISITGRKCEIVVEGYPQQKLTESDSHEGKCQLCRQKHQRGPKNRRVNQ